MRAAAVLLLAGVLPAQAGGRPPTVIVVAESTGDETETRLLQHLLRVLDEAETRGAVAPAHELGKRTIEFGMVADPGGAGRRMSPPATAIREQAVAADVVICVGLRALLPFLDGPPLPEATRLYSYACDSLSHLPTSNELLDNLARVRGGMTPDVSLEQIVRRAGEVLARPGPMGVILSRRLPEARVTPALRAARELDLDLEVEWIDSGREVAKAADRLVTRGIRTLVFVPDPFGTDSRIGRLALEDVRLRCIREGIALMGASPDDAGGHFALRPEPALVAERMATLMLWDWRTGSDAAPGLEPAPAVRVSANAQAAARDGIPLVK